MQLTDKDKEYLISIGYETKDFKQIEDAIKQSTLAIFKDDIDKCQVVSCETAMDLVERNDLLSLIARSAFHYSASIMIPHTFNTYSLDADSGVLFGDKPSRFLTVDTEFYTKEIDNFKANPQIRVSNIEWDTSDEEYENEEDLDLPSEILISIDKFPAIVSDLDDISDYISDVTGFCHYGEYNIECNYTTEELYAMMDKIDRELSEEYKDGETVWASNLECMREELEAMICLMEEYEEECNLEQE